MSVKRHPPVTATVCTDRGIYSGIFDRESDGGAKRNIAGGGGSGVDSAGDPNVRRVVYNVYRGLLGTYNDQANGIIDAMPPERVREDQGISKQVESMM